MGPRRVIAAVAVLVSLTIAAPARAAVGDGGFISANNGYYRIIGGAALRVGNCAAVENCAGAVPDNPANYRTTPRDGTFLRVANGPNAGLITRVAGGVPFGLSTCGGVWGGCPGTFNLDADGYSAYISAHPNVDNGTFVRVGNGAWLGLIARAAGGALLGLGTCKALNDCAGFVDVDITSFQQYIAAHPTVADGTFLRAADGPIAGAIARVVGDSLVGVGTCAPLNGCPGYVDLDNTAFRGYADAHPNIADGRFVRVMNGALAGLVARAAGGRLLFMTDCGALGGCAGAVDVDQTGFTQYQDVHPFVADGTVLKGVPSGHLWRITRAGRTTTSAGSPAIEVNDATITQFMDLDPPAPVATGPRTDIDGDGTAAPQDCDDAAANVHPGAPDAPGDGVDQDCSGVDAAYPVLDTPLGAFFSTRKSATRFTSLYVRQVPAGSTVTLRCQGRGCPFTVKTVAVRVATKRLSLLSLVRKARLRKGVQFEVRVTHAGMVGRVTRIAIRAPKSPKRSNLCLAPGTSRAAACG